MTTWQLRSAGLASRPSGHQPLLFVIAVEPSRGPPAASPRTFSPLSFATPIVTKIEPDRAFYPAEAYHQNYLTLHPMQLYIAINDLPKIEALKRPFPSLYRDAPVLVGTIARTAVNRGDIGRWLRRRRVCSRRGLSYTPLTG